MIATGSSTLLLVFRSGYEYVFTHGETRTMLTVTLSSTALHLFRRDQMTADDVAKHAAEWALLNNRLNGMVDLSAMSDDLTEFYQYCFQNTALTKRAC